MTDIINFYSKNISDNENDYFSIFKHHLFKLNKNLQKSNTLSNKFPNLIQEDFTDNIILKEIINFRKNNKKTILICIITEFHSPNDEAFNNFNSKNSKVANFISNLIFFNYRLIKKISKFLPSSYKKKIINYNENISNLLFKYLSQLFSSNFSSLIDFEENRYFKRRFKQFQKIHEYFDYFIKSHELIHYNFLKNKKIINLFYPYRQIINSNQKYYFFFSGLNTKYRIEILKKIEKNKYIKGQKIFTDDLKNFTSIKNDDDLQSSYFSLCIPKNEKWIYLSPTKLYRSNLNNQIPITLDIVQDETYPCLKMNLDYLCEGVIDNRQEYYDRYNAEIKIYLTKRKKRFYDDLSSIFDK